MEPQASPTEPRLPPDDNLEAHIKRVCEAVDASNARVVRLHAEIDALDAAEGDHARRR